MPNPPSTLQTLREPQPDRAAAGLRWLRGGCLVLAVALGGCASGVAKTAARQPAPPTTLARLAPPVERPGPASDRENDGSSGVPAAELLAVPDAEPVVEPIRRGGPNRPYSLRDRSYQPLTEDLPFREVGIASWYGRKFHGRRTASGEVYDMHAMTAAHPTLPLPSFVRVVNPANGREVVLRVNDRGPFHGGRIIDLSYAAAHRLGVTRGPARVEVERLTFEDIRTGAWRRGAPADRPGVPAGPEGVMLAQASPAAKVASDPAAPEAEAAVAPLAAPPLPTPSSTASLTPSATPLPAPPATAPTSVAVLPGAAAGEPAGAAAGVLAAPAPDKLLSLVSTLDTTPAASAPAAAAPATSTQAAYPPPTATPARVTAQAAPAAPGFWVQLGAFRVRDGAEGFQRRVQATAQWLAPMLGVLSDQELYRLLAGPYRSHDEAHGVAQRVRESLSLVPLVIEKR